MRSIVYLKTTMRGAEPVEGEPIEHKIKRVLSNNEPIGDGAPMIYEEKGSGVNPAHDIRTDRWEIAAEAMDKIHRLDPKRDDKGEAPTSENTDESKVVELTGSEDGQAKSVQGQGGSETGS